MKSTEQQGQKFPHYTYANAHSQTYKLTWHQCLQW